MAPIIATIETIWSAVSFELNEDFKAKIPMY